MSTKQTQAVRMLKRKRGATIDELTNKLELASEGAARSLITRVKQGGLKVDNVGPRRFTIAA
jgi:hypothetical protein